MSLVLTVNEIPTPQSPRKSALRPSLQRRIRRASRRQGHTASRWPSASLDRSCARRGSNLAKERKKNGQAVPKRAVLTTGVHDGWTVSRPRRAGITGENGGTPSPRRLRTQPDTLPRHAQPSCHGLNVRSTRMGFWSLPSGPDEGNMPKRRTSSDLRLHHARHGQTRSSGSNQVTSLMPPTLANAASNAADMEKSE